MLIVAGRARLPAPPEMDWDPCVQHNCDAAPGDRRVRGTIGTHNVDWSDAHAEIGY